jgi:septal ring factor EnvC (AmiA/AmiB activator)
VRPGARSKTLSRAVFSLAALLLIAAAPPPTQQQLQESERARAALEKSQQAAQARATAAKAEEARLAAQRVAAAAALRELETSSAKAADRVTDLARQRRDTEAQLAESAAALAPFLPIIQRLALYPAETLLAVPMPPEQAVRGIVVLGGLTHELEDKAASLRAEQAELDRLSHEIEQAEADLTTRQAAQARQAAELDAALGAAHSQRAAAEDEASDWSRRAAAEASHAANLRAAIARIEAEQAATAARLAAEARQASDAKSRADLHARQEAVARPAGNGASRLVVPVAGSIEHNFGDAVDGVPSSGITYAAPPAARVVAPCGGRVVFAGPFRTFGQLMIVDCGAGVHVVLSGFDRIDAGVGQAVQAGEPVGVMPGWNPLTLIHHPALIMELRRDGQATNPAPLLRDSS